MTLLPGADNDFNSNVIISNVIITRLGLMPTRKISCPSWRHSRWLLLIARNSANNSHSSFCDDETIIKVTENVLVYEKIFSRQFDNNVGDLAFLGT